MKKYETIKKLVNCGVVAVIRAENEEKTSKIAQSCIDGGIIGIEITFTVPKADMLFLIYQVNLRVKVY